MRELLTMEETLRKCSFQLPEDPGLLEEPVACKNVEKNAIVSPQREENEQLNVLKQEEKKDNSFEDAETEVEKSVSLTNSGCDNSVSNCSTFMVTKNLDVTEYSKVPFQCSSVLNQTNSSAQQLHDLDTKYSENEDKSTLETCTSLDIKCDGSQSINFKESKKSLIVNVEEVECDDRNKVREEMLHAISAGKLAAIENSCGSLAQHVSNTDSGATGEQCSRINENNLQTSDITLLSSRGDDGDDNSSTKSNTSLSQEGERTQNHIQYLLKNLPELAKYFDIRTKIGVGTFSSVFLASLKEDVVKHFPNFKDRKFAIKHLVPTLLPRRIARELRYLHEIGGKENVVGVDLSFRNGDCVVFIMPYFAHKRFSEYVLDMDVEEARDYMRNLMIALKRVHSFNVIHRDIKPSNFLYNRETKRYLLVDFGLSQNVHPQVKLTTNESIKKRKRQEENGSENFRKVSQTSCKTSITDLKAKRMILQSQGKEGNVIQTGNSISQPVKRIKLSDSCTRGQKMIEHLNQQKMSTENKRTPLTPKMFNHQKIPVSQSFKLQNSPKVGDKDINIKKKLFLSNNENEQPRMRESTMKGESPVRSHSSSFLGIQKPMHHNIMSPKPSSFMAPSNLEHVTLKNSSQQSDLSKQKFQTLVPKIEDGNKSGSTVVRVQNSQVKMQMLKPLSPLESEKLRKLLLNKQRNRKPQVPESKCSCKNLPKICGFCRKKPAKPAPRAGTPGFRPPEVLLKCTMQTTAVDMWAAGVIMLCILSGCYPFFRSPDDITGLAEMATIFGTERIKQEAKGLGRNIHCSNNKPPLDLRKLCERLRRRRKERFSGVLDTTNELPICPKCDSSIEIDQDGCLCLGSQKPSICGEFPPSAYDLLQKLLDLNPVTRISAKEALQHPFLKGE